MPPGLSLWALIAETGSVTERLRVREIDDDEGRRLVRIVRRGSGSVVTWRRAQMVLLSAQGMEVPAIAEVAFTSQDRVRDVIRNFNADGFNSLYPRYKGGHPPKFTLGQRREIKKIARSKPADHDLPFSTWSLVKLADFLVAEGVVEDISHEGLRALLRAEGVTFQRLKTWKASKDPRYAEKKARVEHLYAVADREITPADGDPEVVFCVDEFGPLNLQPRPGRQWAPVSGTRKEPGRAPRRRMRATYTRTAGVRHLFAALELGEDKLFGHIKPRKTRARFLEFCRYLRSLYPLTTRDRDHLRQLQPAPDHQARRPGRGLGDGKQRRDRLHAGEFVLAEPVIRLNSTPEGTQTNRQTYRPLNPFPSDAAATGGHERFSTGQT